MYAQGPCFHKLEIVQILFKKRMAFTTYQIQMQFFLILWLKQKLEKDSGSCIWIWYELVTTFHFTWHFTYPAKCIEPKLFVQYIIQEKHCKKNCRNLGIIRLCETTLHALFTSCSHFVEENAFHMKEFQKYFF